METCEYLCLKCGTHYKVALSCSNDAISKKCPKCSSANTVSLNPASFFDFKGGG